MPRKEQMDRTFSFYFPTKELFDDWKKAADEYGSSPNNYIFEMAESGRSSKEDSL